MEDLAAAGEIATFGIRVAGVSYVRRRAAYVICIREDRFAAVAVGQRRFLPGGGCEPEEPFEAAAVREVREELAVEIVTLRYFASAVQLFFAAAEEVHFATHAQFFRGSLGAPTGTPAEHALEWVPIRLAGRVLHHASHAWAVAQAAGDTGQV